MYDYSTLLVHTYECYTHLQRGTYTAQLVTVRGDLVQVEICVAQGVCARVCVESDFGETTQRTILITLYPDLLLFP